MKRLAPRRRSQWKEKKKEKRKKKKKRGKSLLPFTSPCGFTCLTELRSWKREMNARPPLNQPPRWSFILRIVFGTAQFSQLYARPRLCPLEPFQPLPHKCISALRQKTYNIFEARVSLCYPHRRAYNDLRPAASARQLSHFPFLVEKFKPGWTSIETPVKHTKHLRMPIYIYMRAIPNDFQPSGSVTSKSSRLFAIRLRWRISRRESHRSTPFLRFSEVCMMRKKISTLLLEKLRITNDSIRDVKIKETETLCNTQGLFKSQKNRLFYIYKIFNKNIQILTILVFLVLMIQC